LFNDIANKCKAFYSPVRPLTWPVFMLENNAPRLEESVLFTPSSPKRWRGKGLTKTDLGGKKRGCWDHRQAFKANAQEAPGIRDGPCD